MTGAVELATAPARWPFLRFLRDELTLEPGRWERMVRITVLVCVVTIVSNALRVPEVGISAFVIFMISGADVAATVRAGIGGIVALTIAILLALFFFTLAAAEPVLRLSLMACAIFGFFYLMKATRLGPVAFLVGFVAAYTLTLFDRVPSPELLIRGALWIWVALAYPIAALVILDVAFGWRAERIFRLAIAGRLEAAATFLATAPRDDSAARSRVEHFEREGTAGIARFAAAGPGAGAGARAAIVRQVDLLLLLLRELPAGAKNVPETREALARAGEELLEARRILLGEDPSDRPAFRDRATRGTSSAADLPLLRCVRELGLTIRVARHPRAAGHPTKDVAPEAHAAPGAPASKRTEALRFAVKVTVASMTAYVIYAGLKWSGIHTAMLTTFFVAQDSVGATIHKFTLRIAGAVVGGAIGILSIVFILPQLESIGGLVILVAIVTLFAAWFATGSQAIAYAGVQIGFAFYLAVLQGFSRTSNMVVARDRVIGILLGNLIVYVVFTRLWPVHIKPAVRQALSRALESLASVLQVAGGKGSRAALRESETAFHTHLGTALQSAYFRRLEPGDDDGWSLIPAMKSLFVRIHAIAHQALHARVLPPAVRDSLSAEAANEAKRLSQLAASLEARGMEVPS